jgi:hypothetical protein
MTRSNRGASGETLVETAALMVSRAELADRLAGQGLDTKGKQEDLALRVAHSFKAEDVFDMLDEAKLARLGKDFDVPTPPRAGFFDSEKDRWRKHLVRYASRVRPQDPATPPSPKVADVRADSPAHIPTQRESATPQIVPPVVVTATTTTYPAFAELLSFVIGYGMGYKWRSKKEESYQAELFGALRLRFPDAALRIEQAGPGKRWDIVVGDTIIEIKLPRRSSNISDWQGQIDRYVREKKELIVVSVEHHLTDGYGAEIEYKRIESLGPQVHVVRKQLRG